MLPAHQTATAWGPRITQSSPAMGAPSLNNPPQLMSVESTDHGEVVTSVSPDAISGGAAVAPFSGGAPAREEGVLERFDETHLSTSTPAAEPREYHEQSIEELVSSIVIHQDKPIEHLPFISPPELKLIGRCVTFKGDTTISGEMHTFVYEGLVATINKDTVMLIQVNRYTEEDFQVQRLERRDLLAENGEDWKIAGKRSGTTVLQTTQDTTQHTRSAGATREEVEADANNLGGVPDSSGAGSSQPRNGADLDFDHRSVRVTKHPEGSQLLNELGETHEEATQRVRNRMRQQTGSMGPIPYVTFSRSNIHNVEFGVDPRSPQTPLLTDPSKEHVDMQFLRMFVRRYIIHTSQHNNPRRVPLRAFVTYRCNCSHLDNDLLERVAREELAHLLKIDRDVKRMKQKKDQSRRNVLRAYRAPNGIFRLTGILYLTHLPRQTFTIAVMEMFVNTLILIYIIATMLSAEVSVIAVYLNRISPYVFATVTLSLIAAGCTALHSIRMALPIRNGMCLVGFRIFSVFGAIACATMTMIVAGENAGYKRFTRFIRTLPAQRLCYFYETQGCSGIATPCSAAQVIEPFCQCFFLSSLPTDYSSYPCQPLMLALIQRGLIPLVGLSFTLFAVLLFDAYLLLRLFHVAHLLERRM